MTSITGDMKQIIYNASDICCLVLLFSRPKIDFFLFSPELLVILLLLLPGSRVALYCSVDDLPVTQAHSNACVKRLRWCGHDLICWKYQQQKGRWRRSGVGVVVSHLQPLQRSPFWGSCSFWGGALRGSKLLRSGGKKVIICCLQKLFGVFALSIFKHDFLTSRNT